MPNPIHTYRVNAAGWPEDMIEAEAPIIAARRYTTDHKLPIGTRLTAVAVDGNPPARARAYAVASRTGILRTLGVMEAAGLRLTR